MKHIIDISTSNPKNTLHIYQRVSTEIQKTQGNSLDTQLKSGIKESKKLKMDWMIWDEGAKSGSRNQEDRVIFNNLMMEVKQGNVKHIFFQDITRSQRNYEYEYYLIKTCKDFDCNIYDLGRKYDLNNAGDNFFLRLQSLFGQYENQQRRQRSVLGKRDHFLRGGWRGGTPPFGYDTIDRKLVINEKESIMVEQLFKEYASGETLNRISNVFLTKGFKPRRSSTGIFNIGTLRVMLKNEIYIGKDRMKDPDEPEKILEYNKVPMVVDVELFNKVQKEIDRNKKNVGKYKHLKKKKDSYPVLLRQMIRCDDCGQIWGVRVKVHKNEYVYFCRNRENLWRATNKNDWIKCGVKRSANISKLDELVWNSVLSLNEESHILKEKDKTKILQPINPNQSRSWKQRLNYLRKTNITLQSKREFVYEQFVSGEIEKPMLDKLNTSIKTQISDNELEIKKLDDRMSLKKQKDGFVDWVGKRQKRIKGMSEITDVARKIEIIKEFVDKILINHNKETNRFLVSIHLKLPLFNDKLVWNNPKDKSKGYLITEGTYMKNIYMKKVVLGRPFKDTENDEITDENKKKVH